MKEPGKVSPAPGPGDPPPAGVSYWDYLRIDELLALQGGVERDESKLSNHEVLFIAVHQVFELWFKLVIRELAAVRDLLHRTPVPESDLAAAVASLRRVQVVMEQMANHWRLMETLTTRDFLDFRDKLLPASGFQSGQFREVEVLLGLPPEERMRFGGDAAWLRALEDGKGGASPSLARVRARLASGPSIREVVDDWLHRTPIRGSSPRDASPGGSSPRDSSRGDPAPRGDADAADAAVVRAFADDFLAAHSREIGDPEARAARQATDPESIRRIAAQYRAEIEAARRFLLAEDAPEAERQRRARIRAAIVFLESYRELPLLAWPRELLDALVAAEQSMLVFRQRHARMVEREIGRRTGTGGSPGVAYLDETAIRYRVFSDLWTVRTVLLRRGAVPPLGDASFYEFRYRG
jgi:tryptophan 2,3-dioxygenase